MGLIDDVCVCVCVCVSGGEATTGESAVRNSQDATALGRAVCAAGGERGGGGGDEEEPVLTGYHGDRGG